MDHFITRANHSFRIILLAAALVLAVFVGGPRGGRVAALSLCAEGRHYFHDITVGAGEFSRIDKVVEVQLNLTPLLAEQEGAGEILPSSLCLEERQGEDVVDGAVVFQFDPAADFNAAEKARGTLSFLMGGETAAAATRSYRLYFDTAGEFTLPIFDDLVAVTDDVDNQGYASIQIDTAGGDYIYHKPGGGFAALLDADANDWISWNPANGAAGDFRGIPNMVHPNNGGYFHPGRNNVNTTLVSDGPLKTTFVSTSKNGGDWVVRWDVFPTYARMTVLKQANNNYWWLYEGTPGGELQPQVDRLTRSNGDSIKASQKWTTDIPGDEWLYVTDPNVSESGRSLYLIHHQDDNKVDGYTADNTGQMTIFGFGRNGNKRQLNTLPQQFTFGLTDETAVNNVQPVVNSAYKPLIITGENDTADDPDPGPTCEPLTHSIYLSPKKNIKIDNVQYGDEDVLKYDGATCVWSLVFDGSAAGLPASANVNAFAIDGDDLYLSFLAPVNVPDISGKVDDSDVVLYSEGEFSLYLDGSVYDLTTNPEDIDALAFDNEGNLLISTLGAYNVTGLPKGKGEDVLRFTGSGWEVYFDGSHNAGLNGENLAGLDVDTNGELYLSVMNAFKIKTGGINGNGTDIFICTPNTLGLQTTECQYTMFKRTTELGLKAFDALDIE